MQCAIGGDAVLSAELLPELGADLVSALTQLKSDYLARHGGSAGLMCLEGDRKYTVNSSTVRDADDR